MSEPAEEVVDLGRRRGRLEADVEERAPLELDAGPEAADREKDHAGHDEQRAREEVPPLALDDAEEHTKSLTISDSPRHSDEFTVRHLRATTTKRTGEQASAHGAAAESNHTAGRRLI